MAFLCLNLNGFETGTLDKVYGVVASVGNDVSVSTTQVHNQQPYPPSAYSCHLQNTFSGGQAQFNIGKFDPSFGTIVTSGLNNGILFLRLYVYLVGVTSTVGNGTQLTPLVLFADGASNPIGVFINSSRNIVAQDNGGTYHTGTTVLSLNQWYRIDVEFNNTAHTWAVAINNNAEVSGSASGYPNATSIVIGGSSTNNFEYYVDDMWLDQDNVPPEGGTILYTATGNGTNTGWSGTASSTVPPSSTGAISSTAFNDHRSVTTNAAIPTSSSVNLVVTECYVKPGNSTNSLSTSIVSGGTTTDSSGTNVTVGAYSLLQLLYPQDPNGTIPWTVTSANAAQPGVRNAFASGTAFCEAIYLEVDCRVPIQLAAQSATLVNSNLAPLNILPIAAESSAATNPALASGILSPLVVQSSSWSTSDLTAVNSLSLAAEAIASANHDLTLFAPVTLDAISAAWINSALTTSSTGGFSCSCCSSPPPLPPPPGCGSCSSIPSTIFVTITDVTGCSCLVGTWTLDYDPSLINPPSPPGGWVSTSNPTCGPRTAPIYVVIGSGLDLVVTIGSFGSSCSFSCGPGGDLTSCSPLMSNTKSCGFSICDPVYGGGANVTLSS